MSDQNFNILSGEQIQLIHETTLRVLDEVGIEVMHEDACQMWVDWGAKRDNKSGRIHIPPNLAEQALNKSKSEIFCGARDEKNEFIIGKGRIYGRNGGGPGQVIGLTSGELRNATKEDAANYARLVDALENTHIAAPVYEQDSKPETRDIHTLALMFKNTSKHINIRLLNPNSLPYFMRMAELIAGGKNKLKEKPVITMLESPISPLKHPAVLIDTILACGNYGIPLEICSMPIAGATGPITLSGSLLMSNVEMLAAVIFGQLAYPGMPMIFAPRIMVMDMASGYALTGSMENALLVTAGVQLAKEAYHMPINVHGPYTDSPISDCQAGIENTYFSLMPAMAGADILTGAGHLQGGLVVNFAQLIIDDELMGMVIRAREGLVVDEEMLGFNAIKDSIQTGNLLMHPHTLRHLRSNRYRTKIITRTARSNWQDKGSKSMQDRAVEKVKSILKNHQPLPLNEDINKAIDKLLVEADKKIA
ncbi:MAG: trimethylamine methyltransferase family protein [Anaerolineaceae bacterium]|nr:trimethylamine methyltransferase family protein [Anaerolineaceae bacterium]